jgi:hypothetical protein
MLRCVIKLQFPLSSWVLLPVVAQLTFLLAFFPLQFILVCEITPQLQFQAKGNVSLRKVGEIKIFVDTLIDVS